MKEQHCFTKQSNGSESSEPASSYNIQMRHDDPNLDSIRQTFEHYNLVLRRSVLSALVKPRQPLELDDLAEKAISVMVNPPMIDRRLRDVPSVSRKVLAIMAITRNYRWPIGDLLQVLVTLGHHEGLSPIQTLLEAGLLYPDLNLGQSFNTFDELATSAESLRRQVFTVPEIASRAIREPMDLPVLGEEHPSWNGQSSDGLEWMLRLSVAVQMVMESPVRQTQAGVLFKRDALRLKSHVLLKAAPDDSRIELPDHGTLALAWAAALGWIESSEEQLIYRKAVVPPESRWDLLTQLLRGLLKIEIWDPVTGHQSTEDTGSTLASMTTIVILLLGQADRRWVSASELAEWIWGNHPHWQGHLSRETQKTRGASWIEPLVLGVLYPLGLVDVAREDDKRFRISAFGRYLVLSEPKPEEPSVIAQALLVQPNAEVLAFRQCLTPPLIAKLTRIATWKRLGAACTLELNAEQMYRGLESGLTLAGVLQTLNQHGTKPVPATVSDLLQRWTNKRERLSVYPSATLVEFLSAADLDQAISRGLVALRVSDRIGICSDGADPDFKQLRLLGNRDYDLKPSKCVQVEPDGITLRVDTAQADLLLETEITRIAELRVEQSGSYRQFEVTPPKLCSALAGGWNLAEIETWFFNRTGHEMPASSKLFAIASSMNPIEAQRRIVLELPSEALTNGIVQWPVSSEHIADRLGPTMLAVDDDKLDVLRQVLGTIGLSITEVQGS